MLRVKNRQEFGIKKCGILTMKRGEIVRRDGGRGLISVERCIREEENSLGFYVANSEENLIRGVLAAKTINTR